MRIGFDAKRAFLNRTGLGNYSRGVIDLALISSSVKSIVLFTPNNSKPLLSETCLQNGRVETVTPPWYFLGPFKSMWRTDFVTGQFAKHRLDLYHGLSNELPNGIEKSGVASVVTIHDLIFLHYPKYYKSIDRKIYDFKVRHACEMATRIIATSQQTANDIVSKIGIDRSKISVVYQGCDQRFQSSVSKEELNRVSVKLQLPVRYILCVGTIEERKNAKVIVGSLNELKDSEIKLVLLGRKTRYAEELIAQASELGLDKRLTILSGVDTADLPAVYQQAELFVLPSLMEGFGIPVLEAMTSGVPVIVSANSCLSEVCGDAGIQIDPTNPTDIATAIDKVIGNHEMKANMIRLGKIRAKHFDKETIEKEVIRVYELARTEYLK